MLSPAGTNLAVEQHEQVQKGGQLSWLFLPLHELLF